MTNTDPAPDPDRLIVAIRTNTGPWDYVNLPAAARIYHQAYRDGNLARVHAQVMDRWPLRIGRRLTASEFMRMHELAAALDEEHELEARPDAA
jgi:hypothetical protein